MGTWRFCASAILALGCFATRAQTTPLVTGNGFGFAVVSQTDGSLSKFYAHPYRYSAPNPKSHKDDGINTLNFITKASWTNSGESPGNLVPTYLAESQIIHASSPALSADFFMPFGLARNALITRAQSTAGVGTCLDVKWTKKIAGKKILNLRGETATWLTFKGASESLVILPLFADGSKSTEHKFCGPGFVFLVSESEQDATQAVAAYQSWRQADDLIARELNELEQWRATPLSPTFSPNELKLWRQSETILRMAQIREPNRPGRTSEGLILASLPEGEWFIPWVRDMTFSIAALTHMGHQEEAARGLNAFLNAGPTTLMQSQVRGVPYQISTVRYFGDGSEDADFSGAPYQNLELDDWGLALWAMGEYFTQYHDMNWLVRPAAHGNNYVTARDYIVKPLLANLDVVGSGEIVTKDSSIWEQNGVPRMHYAFTTSSAISGLKAFLPLAEAMGDTATAAQIRDQVTQLQLGFLLAFVQNGEVHGTMESYLPNAMDGALLETINTGALTDPGLIQSTLARMDLLKTGSGGYRRVRGSTEYEKHEFLFVDFSLARVDLRLQQTAQAEALVQHMISQALQDNGFIPEMYVSQPSDDYPGPVGAPAGAVPMVGYGAGTYIFYLYERLHFTGALL